MKKLYLLLILISIVHINSKTAKAAYPYHEFGLEASMISGAGLSYQLQYDVDWAMKINGLGFYFGEDLPDNGDLYIDLGIEVQRNFWKKRSRRAFLFAGMSYWYMQHRETEIQIINDREILFKNEILNDVYNVGVGIGVEIMLRKRFVLSFQVGFLIQQSKAIEGFELTRLIDYSKDSETYYGPAASFGFKIRF